MGNSFRIFLIALIYFFIQLNLLWINNYQTFINAFFFQGLTIIAFTLLLRTKKNDLLHVCIIITALINICILVWSKLFYLYCITHPYKEDIFRGVFLKPQGPLYGIIYSFEYLSKHWDTLFVFWMPALILSIVFAVFINEKKKSLDRNIPSFNNHIFLILFLLTFMFTSGWPGFLKYLSHYADFAKAGNSFSSTLSLLKNYTDSMPHLFIHSPHYPPGFALLMRLVNTEWLNLLPKAIVLLSCILTIIFLQFHLKKWGGEQLECNFLYITFILCAPILIFPKISLQPICLFFSALVLFLFEKMLYEKKGGLNAFLLGISMACFFFFSFISIFVVFFLVCYLMLLAYKKKLPQSAYSRVIISIISFFLLYFFLFLLTDFNIFTCFINALNHRHGIPGYDAYDSLERYMFRSTGNLIPFLYIIGSPIVMLVFMQLRNPSIKSQQRCFLLATIITIMAATFSGSFFLETERIWIIFLPPILLVASRELSSLYTLKKFDIVYGIIIFLLIHILLVELLIDHSYGNFM